MAVFNFICRNWCSLNRNGSEHSHSWEHRKKCHHVFQSLYCSHCKSTTFYFFLTPNHMHSLPHKTSLYLSGLKLYKRAVERIETSGEMLKVCEPTPCFAGMVVIPKKSRGLRICAVFKALNQSLMTDVSPTAPFQACQNTFGKEKVSSWWASKMSCVIWMTSL